MFEVLMAVKISVVSWVVALCSVVVGYQHFGGLYCLHLLLSTLKMDPPWSSKTMAFSHHSTQHKNPENLELYPSTDFQRQLQKPRSPTLSRNKNMSYCKCHYKQTCLYVLLQLIFQINPLTCRSVDTVFSIIFLYD
jgi:hypothetical protein